MITLIRKNETRCFSCVDFRKVLKVTATRVSNYDPNIVSRNMPNKYMTADQRNLKLEAIQRERKRLLQSRNRVETKIENMISREGVALEEEKIQNILGKVLEKEPVGFDENAPKFLLWEQQKKINLLKNKSAMKWHPFMIRWCLSIYLKSPGNIFFFSVTVHSVFCVSMSL